MRGGSGGGWTRWVGIGLLVVAAPVIVAAGYTVLVGWPVETMRGVAGVFSGRDVVQTADDEKTGLAVALVVGLALLLARLLHLHLTRGIGLALLLYASLLAFPLALLAGLGANYGLEWLLEARGYQYCGYHVLSKGKGAHGTYAYARSAIPDGCGKVAALFPPGQIVMGNTGAFDLPQ